MRACPGSAISLIDNAQTLKGERVVDLRNVLRFMRDQVRDTTCGDAPGVGAQPGDHALENAVDQANVAVKETNLQCLNGVGTNDLGRLADFDAWQTRGTGEERFGRDVKAGGDGAAEELSFAGDNIKIGCRAEIDDDAGATVSLIR